MWIRSYPPPVQTKLGSLSGTITVDEKTPEEIAGIYVFVRGKKSDETSYFSRVGSDGKYKISNIPENTNYNLYLQKGEYTQLIEENVEILADQNTEIEPVLFFKWLGSFSNAPENPTAKDAYLNTTNGIFYIYDGTSWEILAESSNNKPSPSTNKTQITYNATEKGIVFKGFAISDTKIIITDNNNNVCMNINYTKPEVYHEWSYTYPLVEEDTEYKFNVKLVRDDGFILEEQDFSITAIGGLGEYKVENKDYKVTLSDDYVLSRPEQKFTNNKNIPILDYGTSYEISSENKDATYMWADNSLWVYSCEAWNSDSVNQQNFDLKNVDDSYWRTFSDIQSMLQGRKLGVRTRTIVKIAGYTYNNTATFSLNDLKANVLDWKSENDKKEYKLFVIYGSDFDNLYKNVPGTKKYILSKDYKSFVAEGTADSIEVYAQEISISENLEEPIYIPKGFTGKWNFYTTYNTVYSVNLPCNAWSIINNIITSSPETIISGTDGEYCPILLTPAN